MSESEKIEISRADLHGPVILGGKNLGGTTNKLSYQHAPGIKMLYCRTHKELHVAYNGDEGIIPSSNVAMLVPAKHKAKADEPKSEQTRTVIKAQASTPQDHVFAGPGGGKTK